jgi:NAD-dependent dihydropyrimidine dehydrogenase PreA subunit
MTFVTLKYIIQNNIIFNNFFKISGRYYLSENFNYDNFNNNNIVLNFCKQYEYQIINKLVNTSLYKLPYSAIYLFYDFLNNKTINEKMYNCIEYEHLFGIFIEKLKKKYPNDYNIVDLDKYGCRGLISVLKNQLHDI